MEGPTDLNGQIDDMLGGIPPAKPVVEPPVAEPPVTEPPVTEPPATEPTEPPAGPPVVPPTEPPVEPPTEPPVEPPVVSPTEPPAEPPTEPPVTEPVVETPEQVVTRLERQNQLLLERVEHLSTPSEFRLTQEPAGPMVPAVTQPATAEPATAAPPGTAAGPTALVPGTVIPTPAPTVPSTPAEQKLIDFLKDVDLENITENPTEFNALLNDVVTQAGIRNVDVVVEKILTSIPNLVAGQIIQQNSMNKMVGDFYDVNQDLKPVKRTVGAFVNEVHAEHPDWKVQDVFKESATRTRKTLGLKEQALGRSEGDPPPANPSPNDPAFARQRGARRGTEPELTGMAGEIDDMLKIS